MYMCAYEFHDSLVWKKEEEEEEEEQQQQQQLTTPLCRPNTT